MDESAGAGVLDGANGEETALVAAASREYLRHWHRLVSTTNWEKGRIISEWRQRLIESGASPQSYSDETWSRLVGNVSGQHVGRLRRVHDRFGGVFAQYPGLYWSHFQAALDWDDAELWLEGAVQNAWSVNQMRTKRWETLGATAGEQPREEELVAAELDEDGEPPSDAFEQVDGSLEEIRDPEKGDPEEEACETAEPVSLDDSGEVETALSAAAPVRPFENLGPLPDDLAEAFENFKLAILSHKLTGWEDVSSDAVIAALDALKALVLAPSEA
jgi:hypothetical protein